MVYRKGYVPKNDRDRYPGLTDEQYREHRRRCERNYFIRHVEKVRAKKRGWYVRHADEQRARTAEQHRMGYHVVRSELITRLGGVCSRCGFPEYAALQIDHINGDGAKDRKPFRSALGLLRLLGMDDPTLKAHYQVLCANCNWIKRAENNENRKPQIGVKERG